jgi:hypothetical protein
VISFSKFYVTSRVKASLSGFLTVWDGQCATRSASPPKFSRSTLRNNRSSRALLASLTGGECDRCVRSISCSCLFDRSSRFTSHRNFTRVTRGPEIGSYYHPLFRRDDPMLCLQMTCIHSKSPQQLYPLDPVALGLGVAPMDLLASKLPTPPNPADTEVIHSPVVDTQNSVQPPQDHESSQKDDAKPDTYGNTIFDTGASSTGAGTNFELTNSQLPAFDSSSADALGFQTQLYSMLLSQHGQASSNAALPLAQPRPKVTPYQSQPLCLPPRPRKSGLRDARNATGNTKANATSEGSTKNSASRDVEHGGSKEELISL